MKNIKDVIIIGGGAVGTSIARYLSKYELDILLLEKNNEICQETTKANSAIVHGGYDTIPGTLKAKLNVLGAEMYPALSEELDFNYQNIGSLVLAFNDKDMNILEELYERGVKNKVKGLEIIDGNKARELDPLVSDKVTAALYCSSAGIVDPFNYTYAMMENAIENGVNLITNSEVIGLTEGSGYMIVNTKSRDYKSNVVINAAGLQSDKIANLAGDFDFKIIPTKGVYRLLRKDPSYKLKKVLFQTPFEGGKGVLVTPTYEGNTMVGPTSELIGYKEDTPTEEESLKTIDKFAKRSVSSLDLNKTIRVFTGIRAKPNTGDFMIYPSNNMKGLVHVGGIESPGLSAAPAIAKYVIDIVSELNLIELKEKPSYKKERKGIPRVARLSPEVKKALIEKNEDYNIKICRCENVSKAEVLEAIKRGAKTVDSIKRRVRAGMGMCQGTYCGPKVREILAEELSVPVDDIPTETHGDELVRQYMKK